MIRFDWLFPEELMSRCSDIRREIMTFMTLKTIVFQNEKITFQLRNFVPFVVCLLPGLLK